MEDKSQLKMVLKHLQDYGKITSWIAFEEYGITRLSAIIYILRNDYDMNIETKMITKKNRYGNTCNFAMYTLIEELEND